MFETVTGNNFTCCNNRYCKSIYDSLSCYECLLILSNIFIHCWLFKNEWNIQTVYPRKSHSVNYFFICIGCIEEWFTLLLGFWNNSSVDLITYWQNRQNNVILLSFKSKFDHQFNRRLFFVLQLIVLMYTIITHSW